MGLLDIAKRAYNYIVGDDNEKSSAAKKTKSPAAATSKAATSNAGTVKQQKAIIAPEIKEKPVDIVESSSKKKPNEDGRVKKFIKSKKEVDAKIKAIHELCKKEGIKFNNVLKQLGIDFAFKTTEEQMQILTNIENGIKEFVKNKKYADGNDVELDKDCAIAARVQNKMDAQEAGIDADKISASEIGNINKDLGKSYEKLSDEEKEQKLNDVVEQRVKEEEEKFDNQITKCKTEAQRAALRKRKAKHIELVRNELYMQFAEVHSAEEAVQAVSIVSANNMAKGIDYALNTKITDEQKRTDIADNKMTVNYVLGLLEKYYQRGETPPRDVLESANRILVSAKSCTGVQQYDNDFFQFRLDCEENGLPAYLSEEQLTAMSTGIGLGITFNENMTTEEKAFCLNSWDEHANKFSDYYEVKTRYNESVEQYLKEHPEAKQGVEEIKTQMKEKYGNVPELPKAGKKRYESTKLDNVIVNTYNKTEIKNESTTAIKNEPATEIPHAKANPQQLEQALSTMDYNKVCELYDKNTDRDFAYVVIHEPKLKRHRQNIVGYLKSLSAEDLNNLIKGCDTDSFLFVLRNVSPHVAGNLYDLSKKDKCYAARKLGEEIIEKGNENAAA